MKTATGLTLATIGAILAFAVSAHPSWVNLQVAGWVILVVGVAGIFIPRRGYGWVRSRVVVRRRRRPAVSAPDVHVVTDTRQPASETVEEYYEE